jgi:hypothetical protein
MIIEPEICATTLQKIIHDLPNGKSIGFSEITNNEMYKYGPMHQLSYLLAVVFQNMIKFNVIPFLFNEERIIPILKNEKK